VVLVDDADCLHPGIHDPPLSSAAAGFFSTIGACRALRIAPAKVAAPKDSGGSSGAPRTFASPSHASSGFISSAGETRTADAHRSREMHP
jgi:hypothetical protein